MYGANCPPVHIDESVRVNYVYDGDTLQLEDGRKIRLIGIDTPEVFSRKRPIKMQTKRYGERAKAALQHQLELSNRRIGLAYGVERFDRYKRTLAHVFLPNGQNIQAWLVELGHAIAYVTPPNDALSACYRQQEDIARKHKRGIWQLPQYQLKRTSQLTKKSRGFHRFQAIVTHIRQSKHKVTFTLDNRVDVKIKRKDLHNFNEHWLKHLKHKKIHIRGWIHAKKYKHGVAKKAQFVMTLRHPDAIKVIH